MKRDNHIFLIIFWMGLSLLFMAFSYKYGLGKLNNPGPGFLPFLLGTILFLISSSLLARPLLFGKGDKKGSVKEKKSGENLGKILITFVSLFAYTFLLELLGYLIGTFLLLIILFWCAGIKRWSFVLTISALTVLATYFLFSYLAVRFPMGIIKFIHGS